MARRRLRRRTIQVRVTISEFELVGAWARVNETSQSTIVRELIERERRRLEQLALAETAAADSAAAERVKIAELSLRQRAA